MQPEHGFDVTTHRRWWIFFCNAGTPGMWRYFLPNGWEHVMVMTTLADDVPIVINPTSKALEFALPLATTAEAVKRFAKDSTAALVAEVDTPDYNLPKHFLVNTCVTTAAYAMGVDVRALTPRQFYRALLKRGAREIKTGGRHD